MPDLHKQSWLQLISFFFFELHWNLLEGILY
jgi:hypothetical protein